MLSVIKLSVTISGCDVDSRIFLLLCWVSVW